MSEVFLERHLVERSVNRAGEARNAISGHMARTLGEIQSLSGVGLSGSTNAALQQASSEIDAGFRKVLGALDDLAAQLRDASNRLATRDDESAQSLTSAVADLTGGAVPTGSITTTLAPTPTPTA